MLLPFLDQSKLRCVRACIHVNHVYVCVRVRKFFCLFLFFTGAALQALRLGRYLAGHTADPVSLAELVNSSWGTAGQPGLHLMRGRRI